MCTTTPVGETVRADRTTRRTGADGDGGSSAASAPTPDAGVEYWRHYYAYALWVPPPWIRLTESTSLHAALTAALGGSCSSSRDDAPGRRCNADGRRRGPGVDHAPSHAASAPPAEPPRRRRLRDRGPPVSPGVAWGRREVVCLACSSVAFTPEIVPVTITYGSTIRTRGADRGASDAGE